MNIIKKVVRHLSLASMVAGVLAACGTTQTGAPGIDSKPNATAKKPVVAVALGGGAARGFAHIGVLKVLEANGVVPDIVVGTSAGSVVGALYASGMGPVELQKTAISLDEAVLGDWSVSSRGVIRGEALQNMVNKLIAQKPIEKFPRKFAATAVELASGKLTVFERGNAGMAVRASSSVPGVFQPTQINGIDFVDGGVVTPVPVRVARRLGADVVIAVDISAKPTAIKGSGALDTAMQSVTILGQTLAEFECAEADIVIRPPIGQIGSTDFNSRNLLILEGEQAALKALPAIKSRLQGGSSSKTP